jgi:putative membrane protein
VNRRPPGARPDAVFDEGLQHERTALAWERTAVATMVAGVVLSRFAAIHEYWVFAALGLLQTAFGGGLLVWAAAHYDDLHGTLRAGDDVVYPRATAIVGMATVVSVGVALLMAVAVAVLR